VWGVTQSRTFTYFLFKVIHSLAFLSKPSGLLEKRECISLNHRTLTPGTSLLSLATVTCLCCSFKIGVICCHNTLSRVPYSVVQSFTLISQGKESQSFEGLARKIPSLCLHKRWGFLDTGLDAED